MPKSRRKLLLILSILGGMTGGFLLDIYLQYSEQKLLVFTPEALREIVTSLCVGGLLGGALHLMYHLLNRKLPWAEQFGARFFATFLGYVLMALSIAWASWQLYQVTQSEPSSIVSLSD